MMINGVSAVDCAKCPKTDMFVFSLFAFKLAHAFVFSLFAHVFDLGATVQVLTANKAKVNFIFVLYICFHDW